MSVHQVRPIGVCNGSCMSVHQVRPIAICNGSCMSVHQVRPIGVCNGSCMSVHQVRPIAVCNGSCMSVHQVYSCLVVLCSSHHPLRNHELNHRLTALWPAYHYHRRLRVSEAQVLPATGVAPSGRDDRPRPATSVQPIAADVAPRRGGRPGSVGGAASDCHQAAASDARPSQIGCVRA